MNPLAQYLGIIKIVAVIALVLSIFGYGYHTGSGHVQAKWDEAKVAQQAAEKQAVMTRLAENAKVAEQHQTEVQTLKKGHANEIAQVRAAAARATAGGLRINAAVCNGFTPAAKADSASGSHEGTSGTGVLPEPYARNIIELMQHADEIVASCRVAQKFITDNGMAP